MDNVKIKTILNNMHKRREIMHILRIITFILVIIGALNWGLVGAFGLDLVALIFGDMTVLSRIVYILVGLSAIIYFILEYKYIFNRD